VAVFVVTWNLNKERQNYAKARADFISQFDHIEHIADPGLESVMFIEVNNSAQQISDYLRQKMDNNDCLLVSRLNSGECAGWVNVNVVEWINTRI